MASVFDDPREVLEPPTWAELEERLGEPLLSFDLSARDVMIPQGLLSCCHVVHQPHCPYHVALSLVGCTFAVRLPDGTTQDRRPLKQVFDGDVLARPRDLAAAVEAVRLMATATAEAQDGLLAHLSIDVWCLNLELAEIWRFLLREDEARMGEVLGRPDELSDEALGALPIVVLPADDRAEVARLLATDSFRHVRSYADRVLVLPSEIGHDAEARYITAEVWGQAGDVSPSARAIVRDPSEVAP